MEWAQATAWQVGLLSLCGGVVALDRRNAFQFMLSQPVVIVTIMGFCFDQLTLAVWLGSLLQLLWMSAVLFGANVPENETVASIIIAGTCFLVGPLTNVPEPALYSLVILLGVPFSGIGRRVDIRLDHHNLDFVARADAMARDGRADRLHLLGLIGLIRSFVAHGVIVGVGLLICIVAVENIVPHLHASIMEGLAIAGIYVMPSLGMAVSLVMLRKRRAMALAALVFGLCAVFLVQGR